MPSRRPPAAWSLVLAWCALCGWFAFVRGVRVPVLGLVDFGFHELGHLVMYVLPIHELLTAAMGSIVQVGVPIGLAAYFWVWRSDRVGAAACMAWGATSLQDASVYVADAPHEQLELVGGEHDWAFVLGPDGLDRLDQAAGIASTVRGVGLLVLLGAGAVAAHGLWQALSARAPAPLAATPATPDDLFPTGSRTPSSDPGRRSTHW